nr:hypothetical protein CFP56_30523 [Quercus suber]
MEAEFSNEPSRSSKEEDEQGRSVKKFKESKGARQFVPPQTLVNYKDSLVGDIPGAYEQPFKYEKIWDDGEDSNTDIEPLLKGHKQDICPYSVRKMEKTREENVEKTSQGSQEDNQLDPNYSLWLLVTRKKNIVRNGCARIPMKPDMGKVDNSKGKLVIARTRWNSMDDDTPQVSLEEDMPVNKAASTRENLVQQHHVMVIPEGENEGNKLPSQVKLTHSVQSDGTRDSYSNPILRRASVLQGGYDGNLEILDDMEAKLDNLQGPIKEARVKYDRRGYDES